MKYEFLNRVPEHRRLLLIFAGWSCDAAIFREAAESVPSGWDTLVVSDYDSTDFDHSLTENYQVVYLLAWSLGVAAAERMLIPERISKKIAVNGTGRPADDNFGIPSAIYRGTCSGLCEASLAKFRKRMAGSAEEYRRISTLLPQSPDIEALKEQLTFISDITASAVDASFGWDYAYLSENDRIFPFGNQKNYWEGKCETIILEGGHVADFRSIVESQIIITEKVAEEFHLAHVSYRRHALPQIHVSRRLAGLLPADFRECGSLLEVGSGTGVLTDQWRRKIKATRATYIDLSPVRDFGAASEEEYIEGDAEEWITRTEEEFDIILTASTIQWFSAPVDFIANAAKRLRPRGVMLCATFSPGNLCELDELRHSPLNYPSAEAIETVLKTNFSEFRIEEEAFPVEFSTPREALLHLKKTGVSGAGKSDLPLSEILRRLRREDGTARLTYRPIYFIAKK